jgi:hypothetical protein
MTEQTGVNTTDELKLERLIKRTFRPETPLSADFEANVMSSIQHKEHRAGSGRLMLIVMMLYWSIASLFGAWLISEYVPTDSSVSYLVVLLPVLAVIAAAVLFIVHQSRLKMSDLFFQTIQ